MVLTLELPDNYGYVILAATSTALVNVLHIELTSVYRRKARVPYPNAYATAVEASTSPEKHRFNCAQKAHAHFTENYPTFLVNIFVAGLKFPTWAAGLGVAWSVARIMYALGYTRATNAENGKGRMIGVWWNFPHLALFGLAMATGWKLLPAFA